MITGKSSYTASVKGKKITFTFIGNRNLPEFSAVTSVSVIPFTESGDLVAVRLRHRGLDLPGGHVEPYEKTPEETMKREVMEEACMTIRDTKLVEVIESDYFDTPSYMLLYSAFVDDLLEFVPSREASERVVISCPGFIEQYEAGDRKLMAKVLENAWGRIAKG